MHIKLLTLLSLALAVAGCGGGSTPPERATTFDLAGRIISASGVWVDGDSNDPYAPGSDNSIPASAQRLSNPALVGGFVHEVTDGQDWYRVTLAEGQAVTLFISDPPEDVDLDLKLFHDNGGVQGEEAAISDSSDRTTESVRVPQTGEYFISVEAFSGGSNYLLTIGRPARLAAAELWPEDDFVPGDVIVRLREPYDRSGSRQMLAASAGLVQKGGAPDRAMLFSLPGAGRASAASIQDREELKRRTIAMIQALRERPEVEYAEPNYIRRPLAIPNDRLYPRQWNLQRLNLPQAWEVTGSIARDGEVIVAVVDTGVLMQHPDLSANLLATGYDFIRDPGTAVDGDGIDSNPDDPGDGESPAGSSYHGTHVAGIIAAVSNNGEGVTGVTWNTRTRIMPIRVLGRGGGTTYDIIQGVRYAAGLENDSGTLPPQRADIINLSLGGDNASEPERKLYEELRSRGIIVVAAAGNEDSAAPSYPAAYGSVISVSATTRSGERAGYSNRGPTIDVAAPGGDTSNLNSTGEPDGILSTLADGQRNPTYRSAQGTSMAAPHVAGVAALMKWLNRDLTADRFRALLKGGQLTTDLGTPGKDDLFGHGLIDALKAVQNSGVTLPPLLAIDHAGPLDFGAYIDKLEFTTRNAGDGEFNITSVTDDADWLEVTPSSLEGSSGTFTARVDRSGLEDGIYGATITLQTDAPTSLSIPVTLLEGVPRERGDTGRLYILLLDPQSLETLETVAVDNRNGEYTFRFPGVAEGEYLLVAGSDMDNDGEICDPGEACGGYPTIERLQPLAVQSEMEDLEFGASFRVTFSALAAGEMAQPRRGFSRWPQ